MPMIDCVPVEKRFEFRYQETTKSCFSAGKMNFCRCRECRAQKWDVNYSECRQRLKSSGQKWILCYSEQFIRDLYSISHLIIGNLMISMWTRSTFKYIAEGGLRYDLEFLGSSSGILGIRCHIQEAFRQPTTDFSPTSIRDRPRSIVLQVFAYDLMEHRGPIVRPWGPYVTTFKVIASSTRNRMRNFIDATGRPLNGHWSVIQGLS